MQMSNSTARTEDTLETTPNPTDDNELTLGLFSANRGSKFLKGWMTFLEDNADLRYPDFASLTTDA